MAKRVLLSDSDRGTFHELIGSLGLSQMELATMTGVSQPWLSQALKGKRKSVESENLKRIANELLRRLENRQADSTFPEVRLRAVNAFLSRFTEVATTAAAVQAAHIPGGQVPLDAANYIERAADRQALKYFNLTAIAAPMCVTGPVQCGKSSLLLRMENKARENAIQTTWFDPKTSDNNARAVMALYELLQDQWGLKPSPSRDGNPESVTSLFHWFIKELTPTANKPRLLIMDDLASLGESAIDEWLSNFVRAVDTTSRRLRMHISIAIGITHHFDAAFHQRFLLRSSIVNWRPYIELGWLNQNEVIELERVVTATPVETSDLFDLFAGQPYLTHEAAADSKFRDAVRKWMADSLNEKNAEAVRSEVAYTKHLNAIRTAILGPAKEINDEKIELIESLHQACSLGRQVSKYDHREFFTKANLLNESGDPTIEIYRLIAEDLKEHIRRQRA